MIKVILIDIDDTLLSFAGYVKQSMKEGFAHFGIAEYDDEMYTVFEEINSELWRQIEQGTLNFEELKKIRWNMIFKELGISFEGEVFEKFFRAKLFDNAILVPGAKELLEYLRGKYVLCAASNGPYEQQMNRLKISGLYDYFDFYFISEKVGARKPNKEYFDYCFKAVEEKLHEPILPEEVMIIGDSVTSDICGGKKNGLKTCLYMGSSASYRDAAEADYVVERLEEVKGIL